MTTTTTPTTRSAARSDDAAPGPVPFLRLARVELRKQVDTRAGQWLLAVVVLLNAALIALVLFTADPSGRTWNSQQDLLPDYPVCFRVTGQRVFFLRRRILQMEVLEWNGFWIIF